MTTRNGKTRQCACCWETMSHRHFAAFTTPTATCEHPNIICAACVTEWITISIDAQYQPRVMCPDATCDAVMLGGKNVKRLTSRNMHWLFLYKAARITQNAIPSLRWCLKPDCSHHGVYPVLNDPESRVVVTVQCEKCDGRACAACDRPEHEGMDCEEYEQTVLARLQEDAESVALIEKMQEEGKIKLCINCGCLLEVDFPSSSVRCPRCLFIFDWHHDPDLSMWDACRRRSERRLSVRFAPEENNQIIPPEGAVEGAEDAAGKGKAPDEEELENGAGGDDVNVEIFGSDDEAEAVRPQKKSRIDAGTESIN